MSMASLQLLLIAAALCYCTLLFQCSTAAPVARSLLQSEMRLLQERAKDRHNLRQMRSVSWNGAAQNNYSSTVFKKFTQEWKNNNCTSVDNCGGTVSRHWCNSTLQKKMYCSQDDHINDPILGACHITFQLDVEERTAQVAGLDLSLFKKIEDSLTNTFYYIYIVYERFANHYEVGGARVIHSGCSGWQTFHINPIKKILDFSEKKEQNITLILAGQKEIGGYIYPMKCEDVSSLFVLDQKVVVPQDSNAIVQREEDRSQSRSNEEEETKEGSAANDFSGDHGERKNNKTEAATTEEQSKPVLLVPIITSFVAGERIPFRFRRNAEDSANMSDAFKANYTMEEETEKEDMEQSPPSDTKVTCELQDRVVNMTEYLRNDKVIAPKTFNIRQCSPSPVTSSQCVQCEPVYGRLEVLYRLYNPTSNRYQTVITVIPGVAVTGCREQRSSC